MDIGDKIKEQRLKKELTQEQLAQLLNVSRSTISSWEVGRNYPDLETIIAISDLFGISLDNLLREDKQMAKETTKQVKRGKIYKIALISVGILFLIYFGYNTKLRFNEHTYRTSLENYGWKTNSLTQVQGSENAYELTENDITYWTYILPTGWVGFPLVEQKPSIITSKNDLTVNISYDNVIGISITPENDSNIFKQFYVKVNQNADLLETKESWSEQEKQSIIDYLTKYQDVHLDMINKTLEKRNEIFGK